MIKVPEINMYKFARITLILLTLLLLPVRPGSGCRISEFSCRVGGLCLPLDKYCDGRDDCGDASDEPKFCTVCNRTYYGDVGRTYALRVPPPQWNRLPFLCHLTFTASGHDQGDIVQIIFDGFSVGRFDEGLIDSDGETIESSLSPVGELPGCPEGFMQLSELGRPFTGGSWCGAATGHQLYYSETSTVTASVKVFHAPMQAATPFEFRIRYKFISQSDAIVRYGAPDKPLELGRVTPGTYCTRQFDECYRKKCRLQSPNYPGMYPRNVTCYWTIRQKSVPTCKHAMVGVSQENEHKALVKRSIASFNKTSRSIRAWSDCTGERDHLIFYDGSSTNDPVLAKYCGGDWLPKVVSRGPEMLVAFHSSPFSAPLQSGIPNRGFELDVDILFSDSDSYDFAKGNRLCEFHINASNPDDILFSRRGRMGHILSPRHTLPPNTTCTYYFHGHPSDMVWISFTNYHLQILQPPIIDNTTLGRNEPLPWITRLRIWDSAGSYLPAKITTPSSITASSTTSTSTATKKLNNNNNNSNSNNVNNMNINSNSNQTTSNYYYYNPQTAATKSMRGVNVDNVWNPVDSYIYGPTSNSIFNDKIPYGPVQAQKFDKYGNGLSVKETFNYIANVKYQHPYTGSNNAVSKDGYEGSTSVSPDVAPQRTGGGGGTGTSKKTLNNNNRKLLVEVYDNEAPKLCDHSALEELGYRTRPCSPFESYVSSGRDMKIEFHTQTGTALYPATFALKYEFIDTNLGGDTWTGRRGEEPVPQLCSRVFRGKRRGDIQSPRNVFLHGRGGARNITCLYRFEAGVGERIRMVLYNVSFGDSSTCMTESDPHSGRPRCTTIDPSPNEPEQRIGELKIFDVPYRDVKIPMGCFCDNTSSMYNAPLTFQSNSKTMELSFTVTKLNISEDFADIYFYASYEVIRVPDCRKKMRLKGSGGDDDMEFPLRSQDSSCEGIPWYIEAQQPDRSLFVLTWGSFLPIDPSPEESLRCNTKNRLIVYSGRPIRVMRVICPSLPGTRVSPLHIFSEDWLNVQPLSSASKPISMILEAINKEPGNIAFSWLEIQRTKASLIQQLDMQTNFTANDTFSDFGYPRGAECEHKCPELDACIGSSLWCDGRKNCPSGYDESEDECGAARKLLELPGGIFAALGCIAAAISACLIFCIFGLLRKRKKSSGSKSVLNGGAGLNGGARNGVSGVGYTMNGMKKDYKKEPLFLDTGS